MPRFAYRALDPDGRMTQGVIEAPSPQAVYEDLRNVRFTVTHVKEQADLWAAVRVWAARLRRVNLWALVVFTRQFATIFNAGVPLLRGLEGLSKQTFNKRLESALASIHNDVKNGVTLARALQKHPDCFTPVYVALVRAGEMAGALGEILDRTAGFLERDFQLRKRLQAAVTYPIFVFFVTIIVTGILVLWVFPTFITLLDGLNVDLPWPTRLLMFITDVVYHPLFFVFAPAAVVGLVFFYQRTVRTHLGRRSVDRILLDLPLIGPIQRKVIISRFCRTLATLLQSGVPMLHALDIVSKVAGNEIVTEILDDVKRGVKAGMKLSQPIREYHLFPPIVPHMVAVGEETGNLAQLLEKLANFYDNEVEFALDSFSTLLEPIMISVMGAVVGFVLLAVFLPVYQILQNFS